MRALVAVVIVLSVPAVAPAAMMTHHDLASLVLESQVVVRADRAGGTDDLGQYRVRRVLTGSGLGVGQTVTVDTQCYEVRGSPGLGVTIPALDREVVLFLTRDAQANATFRLVPSGLRIVAGGKVFRFEQWNNPGCYVPVPQGDDPADVIGESPPGTQLDLRGLEAEIAAAAARVQMIRGPLAGASSPERRRSALLRFFPGPRDRSFREASGGRGFYEDSLSSWAATQLIAAGDLAGGLEVIARARGLRPWQLDNVTDEQLLAEVARADAPAYRKAAAIDLVGLPSAEVLDRLVELARADADPVVRAAAIDRLAGLEGTSSDEAWARRKRRLRGSLVGLLRDRVRTDEAPLVRLAIFECAARWRIALPLRGTAGVALLTRREGERIRYWVGVAAPANRGPVPRLERAGAACAFEQTQGWSSGSVSGGLLEARCGEGPLELFVTTARGVVSARL